MKYWRIANDLRGDFKPATVISYLSNTLKRSKFKTAYRRFMEFADGAHDAAEANNSEG